MNEVGLLAAWFKPHRKWRRQYFSLWMAPAVEDQYAYVYEYICTHIYAFIYMHVYYTYISFKRANSEIKHYSLSLLFVYFFHFMAPWSNKRCWRKHVFFIPANMWKPNMWKIKLAVPFWDFLDIINAWFLFEWKEKKVFQNAQNTRVLWLLWFNFL